MREDPGGRHQCGIGLDGAELVEAGAQIRRRHLFTTCKTKKVMSLQVAFREHKALTRNLIKITRAVRFELEERLRRKAQLFMADEGDFGELMRLTTRVKIHRNFDKLLTTFNQPAANRCVCPSATVADNPAIPGTVEASEKQVWDYGGLLHQIREHGFAYDKTLGYHESMCPVSK